MVELTPEQLDSATMKGLAFVLGAWRAQSDG
jgi:hypothetical protein